MSMWINSCHVTEDGLSVSCFLLIVLAVCGTGLCSWWNKVYVWNMVGRENQFLKKSIYFVCEYRQLLISVTRFVSFPLSLLQLTTNKRVFHLMALRGSSRSVWMQKINAALRQNKNVVNWPDLILFIAHFFLGILYFRWVYLFVLSPCHIFGPVVGCNCTLTLAVAA